MYFSRKRSRTASSSSMTSSTRNFASSASSSSCLWSCAAFLLASLFDVASKYLERVLYLSPSLYRKRACQCPPPRSLTEGFEYFMGFMGCVLPSTVRLGVATKHGHDWPQTSHKRPSGDGRDNTRRNRSLLTKPQVKYRIMT